MRLRLQKILGAQTSAVLAASESAEILSELERLWLIEEAVRVAAGEWDELFEANPDYTLKPEAVSLCLYRILGIK